MDFIWRETMSIKKPGIAQWQSICPANMRPVQSGDPQPHPRLHMFCVGNLRGILAKGTTVAMKVQLQPRVCECAIVTIATTMKEKGNKAAIINKIIMN